MLPKTRKLNLSWIENRSFYRDFEKIFSSGLVLYFRVSDREIPLAMVVVGKRVSLRATERNEAKRFLYTQLEENIKTGSIKNKELVLVLSQKHSKEVLKQKCQELFSTLLNKR